MPHRDQDMWPGPKGSIEYLMNVMWPLVPFTPENGGTRLWTGSHVDHDLAVFPEAEALTPVFSPGDALIFPGSTMHVGGGIVRTMPRPVIVVSSCPSWLTPFELHRLVFSPPYHRPVPPATAARGAPTQPPP